MTEGRLRNSFKLIQPISKYLHFIISIGVIFALAYVLGVTILNGYLKGNDSRLHIAYISWLNQYFPNIPHWYPHQGGGESLVHGYPIFAHLLAVLIHRLSGLTILQTFRLISFLGFPLAALGIYFFCWTVLQKQTVGLIAAIFYLLAPVTWTWMYNWGFFAQQVAFIFLPLSLIAFDRSLKHRMDIQHKGRGRLWFVALVILVVLASLSHLMVGATVAVGMALYTLFLSIGISKGKRGVIIRSGTRIVILTGLSVALIAAIYLVPFYAYGQVANREGLNTPPVNQLHRLPILEFFGLNPIDRNEILTRMQFPLVVTIFAILGILLSLFRARSTLLEDQKARALALTLLIGTVFTLTPPLAAIVLRVSPILLNFINFRSLLLLVMMLMPIIAAYGVWAFIQTMIYPEEFNLLIRGKLLPRNSSLISLRPVLVMVISLLLALICIWQLGSIKTTVPSSLTYGPLDGGIDLNDIWQRGEDNEVSIVDQLAFNNWPAIMLSDTDSKIDRSIQLASLLPDKRPLRIDVSPYHGDFAMDMVTYANASQINSYTFQISLIHAMWGYQQNVYYIRESGVAEYGNPITLNNSAQWFGTKYVFINSEYDPVETYDAAGWELEHREGKLELWRYPDAPEMVTVTTRPVILVIGKPEADSYMTIFRMANNGMLTYEEAFLVEGQPRVDEYTLEDLKPFDAVILYGHDYKNSRKAWEILTSYVVDGGSLFIDTGWEFWIPEWEFDKAPDVLPVQRLTWTDYGMADEYDLGPVEIIGQVDVDEFKPLIWEGQPWTVSGVDRADVREWGQVILSANGKPLIVAGEFGEGRVVWSGMNLISHARYLGENEEEIKLLHNLLIWLTEFKSGDEPASPQVSRDDPDRVEFYFKHNSNDVTWLYWRESYYPDWNATLVEDSELREVPIYRAGPGFMLMPIESISSDVVLQLSWKSSFLEQLAIIPTIVGFLLLLAHVVDGLVFGGNGLTWIKVAITMRLPRPILDEETHREKQKKPLRVKDTLPDVQQDASGQHAMGVDIDDRAANKHLFDEVEEKALLHSWLVEQGKKQDAWADKILEQKKRGNLDVMEGSSDEETLGE